MKWLIVAAFCALAFLPMTASAQQVLPIGSIPQIDDHNPAQWAMSGMTILTIRDTGGSLTPIMRTETYDARLVEILSRTQAPPLRGNDVRTMMSNGRHLIVVRDYLLIEVRPRDAQAAGTTVSALTAQWAASARRVLPQIAPAASRFGI